ncbi:hypothetical protein M8C21_014077 [Ambrosia artemisiifolia]|uniref:Uncharacterized protein n=1 Tax=Ambrosia artemisiifolia TaxID=4212 RepID=A0AAD5GQU4_AMBAR|nr:hypothetical protein M8C21_014077 [Ambrosia artemisiifolia]
MNSPSAPNLAASPIRTTEVQNTELLNQGTRFLVMKILKENAGILTNFEGLQKIPPGFLLQ